MPLLVCGTGLYVDAVVFDYRFGPAADPAQREKLEAMSVEALHIYCIQNNIPLPENSQNKRYVIRAIEQKGISAKRSDVPMKNVLIV